MHIAICDDNVADRKQLERLLKRESDRRAPDGGALYVDSYGNLESLLQNPMQYDLFFVDMCRGKATGAQVLRSLRAAGCAAPVALCSSAVDYRKENAEGRVLYLEKPIRAAELSDVLDRAQKIADGAAPAIELREENSTRYVEEKDILYAVENGRYLNVKLLSGQEIRIVSSAANFFAQVESYPPFFSPNPRAVLNGRHIKETGFRRIVMSDGTVFRAPGRAVEYARYVMEECEK